ncbi:MAG TPA: hypothetical protein H9740_09490 [Candidatus Hungatella pullicola]|nr:hypothetical protein [Candidatus Hungatella pullicola]
MDDSELMSMLERENRELKEENKKLRQIISTLNQVINRLINRYIKENKIA